MRSRLLMIGVLVGLLSVVGFAGPSAAVTSFSPGDIDGVWHMTAFGAYDVRGVSYWGRITFEQGALISGNGGNNGSAATWSGGGLSVNAIGEVTGVIQGSSGRSLQINVKHGRLDVSKQNVTIYGEDQLGVQLIVHLTKASLLGDYTQEDLDGNWTFVAEGYYEVFSTFNWGNVALDGASISGTGAHLGTICTYRGGLTIDGNGLVNGQVDGIFGTDTFSFSFYQGQMNAAKDTIISTGHYSDSVRSSWMESTIIMVKTN